MARTTVSALEAVVTAQRIRIDTLEQQLAHQTQRIDALCQVVSRIGKLVSSPQRAPAHARGCRLPEEFANAVYPSAEAALAAAKNAYRRMGPGRTFVHQYQRSDDSWALTLTNPAHELPEDAKQATPEEAAPF